MAQVVRLAHGFSDLRGTFIWNHFAGILQELRTGAERTIRHPPADGPDLTPYYRLLLPLLDSLLTYPEYVQRRLHHLEADRGLDKMAEMPRYRPVAAAKPQVHDKPGIRD